METATKIGQSFGCNLITYFTYLMLIVFNTLLADYSLLSGNFWFLSHSLEEMKEMDNEVLANEQTLKLQ